MPSKAETDDFLPCVGARAQDRAKTGAKFLDKALPGWAEKITDTINMGGTHYCILAQLFGRYRSGLEQLVLGDTQSLRLGFRGCRHELRNSMSNFAHYYKALSAAWEQERGSRLP